MAITEHLANERTFLAYVRTSLSLMAFGFVIAKFALLANAFPGLQGVSVPSGAIISGHRLGILFASLGCALGVVGSWRFLVVDKQLKRGDYAPAPAVAIGLGAATVITGLFVILSLLRAL
jgi:putative membrane protein